MGTSTDGILAYGYDLGGGDGDWNVREADEYGELTLPWLDEDDDDVADALTRRLLTEIVGFTETWETRTDDEYFARERDAEKALGVEIYLHCSGEYSMYLLAAKVYRAGRGYPVALDPANLMAEVEAGGYDKKLRRALEALGITPTEGRPQWLLASYWG